VDSRTQIVKAMAVIRRHHDGALLVSEYAGPDAAPFHRPLGGHVEFGEYARETVHREFQEEIGQRLKGVRLLGVVENIFQWQGSSQHEIVFLFTAAFADPAAYEIGEQRILDDTDAWTRVVWRARGTAGPPLYPVGIMELIDEAPPDLAESLR
jgi:ADP-ribose pyrophosphatase YjhB (NUDIX family)